MKSKLNKFLSIALFLSLTIFIAQISYASEITGTLSTGQNPTSQNINDTNQTNNFQMLNGQVTNPPNTQNTMMDNFIPNLQGKSDNPGTMLQDILVGILLTFFIGLIVFIVIGLIRKNFKK